MLWKIQGYAEERWVLSKLCVDTGKKKEVEILELESG